MPKLGVEVRNPGTPYGALEVGDRGSLATLSRADTLHANRPARSSVSVASQLIRQGATAGRSRYV
jgi:hypothetical protein